MDTIRAFFTKSGHFFSIFKIGQRRIWLVKNIFYFHFKLNTNLEIAEIAPSCLTTMD